jgi:branched-chain amino acid transport system substrate-binding protein
MSATVSDDGGDPKHAISVANHFITQGIHFVIGHNTSGTSIPVSEVYADSDVLQITPTSTSPKYTERGLWNAIRVIGRDDQQGRVAAYYIAQHFKGKKIALVHDKTPYGKGLVDEVRKSLLAEHIKPAFYEGINPGEKDYSALVSRLKVADVDLVYCGSFLVECGLIRRQMSDHSMHHTVLMAGDICASEEFGAIAGPAIEGTLLTAPPDPRNNADARDVVAAFKRQGIESESAVLYAYAAVEVLKDAIESARSFEPRVVAETIRSGIPFKTVLGPISFDGKGDIKKYKVLVDIFS